MPRLVVVNGPPGCGKSTVAQRFVADHPLALDLEIDRLRRQLGGWKDDPQRAGELARGLALAAAGAHLRAGLDVVVPQYIGRVDVLAQFEQVTRDAGAEHHEIVLMANRDVVAERFLARNRGSQDPMHHDAQELLERFGGPAQLGAMYDRLLLVISARAHARVITAHEGELEQTYQDVLASITPPQ